MLLPAFDCFEEFMKGGYVKHPKVFDANKVSCNSGSFLLMISCSFDCQTAGVFSTSLVPAKSPWQLQ